MVDLGREPSMEEILGSIRRVMARDDAERGAVSPRFEEDVLELTPNEMPPAPAVQPVAPAIALVSETSAAISRQSFDALNAAAGGAGEPALPTATTLDALVTEALKPMLRQWLDRHLPAIVEKMVQREIARISGNSP